MLVCVMETTKQMPKSTLEMGKFPLSPAFEMRDGKLLLKFEQDVPSAESCGQVFHATDAPSVVMRGRKIWISSIA